jgi:hypothetical protein
LLVTTAILGTTLFLTDRGKRPLPAWEVHARGVPAPIWVLDPATRQQVWRPPGLAEHDLIEDISQPHLGADGRTITLSFMAFHASTPTTPRPKCWKPGQPPLSCPSR